jgi:hypothetical protein
VPRPRGELLRAAARRTRLLRGSCHPQASALEGRRSHRRIPRPFRLRLIGRYYRAAVGLAGGPTPPVVASGVGLSLVNEETVVSRRDHQTPRGPQRLTVSGLYGGSVHPDATVHSGSALPDASAHSGAWHHTRSRNVTPPALSLPGPFAAAHCWTTLAQYVPTSAVAEATREEMVRARTSERARTRSGRIRPSFLASKVRPHRLRLDFSTCNSRGVRWLDTAWEFRVRA